VGSDQARFGETARTVVSRVPASVARGVTRTAAALAAVAAQPHSVAAPRPGGVASTPPPAPAREPY